MASGGPHTRRVISPKRAFVSRTSQILFPVYAKSFDGAYWPQWPNGDKPRSGISGNAQILTSASGNLVVPPDALVGHPSIITQAAANLTTGGGPPSSLNFNPGHYMGFDWSGGVRASSFTSGDQATIASLAADGSDNVTGGFFIITWRSLDTGTAGPSYQWAVSDSYVNAFKARNKHYWIWINGYNGGPAPNSGSVTTGNVACPDWITNQNGIFATTGNYAPLGGGCFSKIYNAPVGNALTALIQQIANRYGADPLFEGVAFGVGTSFPVYNGVDTLGTKQPQINYNTDYSDAKMLATYYGFMSQWRSILPKQNLWFTTDYLFNMAGSGSYSGQDVAWTDFFNHAIANKCMLGGPDSWTQSWTYPQTPFTSTGQNAYAPHTNTHYNRAINSDGIFRGWRGPSPGVGNGFRGQILYAGCQEQTEMGGYIGQFSASDVWLTRGPAVDNVHYMFWDFNNGYGGNKAPNTFWKSNAAYEATYGPSVSTWIKAAGNTNRVNPYS